MKSCCKSLLEAIKIVQKVRIEALTIQLEIIRKKEKKTNKEFRFEVILTCWKREAEIFLDLLKEMKI